MGAIADCAKRSIGAVLMALCILGFISGLLAPSILAAGGADCEYLCTLSTGPCGAGGCTCSPTFPGNPWGYGYTHPKPPLKQGGYFTFGKCNTTPDCPMFVYQVVRECPVHHQQFLLQGQRTVCSYAAMETP
jgi:hypothetical protein